MMEDRSVGAVWAAVIFFILLSGCSTTPEAIDAKSDAASQSYSDNYEEVYRRLAGAARRCMTGHPTRALSMEVEANLYRERGLADVRFVAVGAYSNYFLSARVERTGPGSRVSVKVNNPLIGDSLSKMVFRWAGGELQC